MSKQQLIEKMQSILEKNVQKNPETMLRDMYETLLPRWMEHFKLDKKDKDTLYETVCEKAIQFDSLAILGISQKWIENNKGNYEKLLDQSMEKTNNKDKAVKILKAIDLKNIDQDKYFNHWKKNILLFPGLEEIWNSSLDVSFKMTYRKEYEDLKNQYEEYLGHQYEGLFKENENFEDEFIFQEYPVKENKNLIQDMFNFEEDDKKITVDPNIDSESNDKYFQENNDNGIDSESKDDKNNYDEIMIINPNQSAPFTEDQRNIIKILLLSEKNNGLISENRIYPVLYQNKNLGVQFVVSLHLQDDPNPKKTKPGRILKYRANSDKIGDYDVYETAATFIIEQDQVLRIKKEPANPKVFKVDHSHLHSSKPKEIENIRAVSKEEQFRIKAYSSGMHGFFMDKAKGQRVDKIEIKNYSLEDMYKFTLSAIKLLNDLHEGGFTHNDIHDQNCFYDKTSEKYTFIDWYYLKNINQYLLNQYLFEFYDERKDIKDLLEKILIVKWNMFLALAKESKNDINQVAANDVLLLLNNFDSKLEEINESDILKELQSNLDKLFSEKKLGLKNI